MDNVQPLAAAAKTTGMCFVAGTMVWAGVVADAAVSTDAEWPLPHLDHAPAMERVLRPIESLAKGDLVWARCEFSGAEGWKPVIDTITTRPIELWSLEFEVLNQGGPGDAPASLAAGTAPETLTGTATHPFYLVEADEFMPMADLQPGDVLLLADGRGLARVLGLRPARAPPGESFTTYNIEVADFHTYFVGDAGVWVHNTGAACQLIKSKYFRLAKDKGLTGNALHQQRFKLLEESKTSFLRSPNRGVLTGANWADSVHHVGRRMIDDLAVTGGSQGNGVALQHLPTVSDYRRFLSRQPTAGHGRGASRIDIHHSVEEYVQDLLGLGKTADLPGFPMLRSAGGPDGHAALAGALRSAIKAGNTDGLTNQQIVDRLKDVYKSNAEWSECWKVAREWLLHKQSQNFLQDVVVPSL